MIKHSHCHSMKIFPLRADFGGFFLPPCRLKWHQKCPQGFVKRVNTKCRKSRIPDRFGWAGRWEAKPPWRYSPGAAKFSQIKSNIPVLSPPSQELLPSFPPFRLSKLLQTFRTFPFPQAQIYFLLNVKKPHELEQEEMLDVFIAPSFLIFFKDTFQ